MKILFPVCLLEDEPMTEKNIEKAIRDFLADYISAGSILEPELNVTVHELITDKNTVRTHITNWNADILSAFKEAAANMDGELDTQETFEVKNRARDIDNDWSLNSNFAILSDQKDIYPVSTCITNTNRRDITDNPSQYAIVTCTIVDNGY